MVAPPGYSGTILLSALDLQQCIAALPNWDPCEHDSCLISI